MFQVKVGLKFQINVKKKLWEFKMKWSEVYIVASSDSDCCVFPSPQLAC